MKLVLEAAAIWFASIQSFYLAILSWQKTIVFREASASKWYDVQSSSNSVFHNHSIHSVNSHVLFAFHVDGQFLINRFYQLFGQRSSIHEKAGFQAEYQNGVFIFWPVLK